MNIFKKTFGKRHWKTIYSCSCTARRSEMFGAYVNKVDTKIILQVERERNIYRCYITDGNLKQKIDIAFLAVNCPDVIPILEEENINF